MSRFIKSGLILIGVATVLAGQGSGLKSNIPRLPDGKPDFNGVWEIPYVPDMSRGVEGGLPFSEWGQKEWKAYDPAVFDYTGHCLPPGLTRLVNTPMPMEIVQTPKKVVLLVEAFSSYIIAPLDGRKHNPKLEPTWSGDSIASWDGDTLVIDTVGFNDRTKLDTIGHPHSDQLHIIQRYTRSDDKTIDFEMTVDDPKAYTKTWSNKRKFKLRTDWELMEYSCMENNKDLLEGLIK